MKANKPITIITDTREQRPLDFTPYAAFGISTERAKLHVGDYGIKGYDRHIFIERKSLNDLVGTLTHGRERFMREIYDRGAFYPVKHLVIESSWREISSPYSFSAANPLAIVNSLFSLMMPPTCINIFVNPSRSVCAWYVANVAVNFVRRATTGTHALWHALNAPDAADIPPLPLPYQTINERA